MKLLLIATTNPGKLGEIKEFLADKDITILGLSDFPDIRQVEETGETFEENAALKAKGYYEQTKIPCIADDGGLMVDHLNGAPGVKSHRWMGHEATDEEQAEAILQKLKGVPLEKRGARLGGCIVFYDGYHILKRENYTEGTISDHVIGEIKKGFPYRSILIVSRFGKAYSELTDEEHEAVNFRRKNLRELVPEMLKLLRAGSGKGA